MSAVILSDPSTPVSCYRPMEVVVQGRGFETHSAVGNIRPADAADVTALGNGLVVGDILVTHGDIQGPVPAAVGLTLYMELCGAYTGLHAITKLIDQSGGTNYLVIASPDYGSVTPGAGTLVMFPESYTMYCRVSIFTDPTKSPTIVDLKATSDITNGTFTFDVGPCLRDYFSTDISGFAKEIAGDIVQTAHGTTALFYKLYIVEVWDDPTDSDPVDPFDGDWDVSTDTDYRVAVNAIHPFAGTLVDWNDTNMAQFVVGGASWARNILTHAPRKAVSVADGIALTMATTDRFRIHMLCDEALVYDVDYILRIYDTTTGTPVLINDVDVILSGVHAAISVAIGPADLDTYVSGIARYTVWMSNAARDQLSEPVEITVDSECKENRRPFAWLNKLGGIDAYTYTGREIGQTKTKRTTVSKPMSAGVGYDFAERVSRIEVDRTRTVSTGPVNDNVRKWIAQDMCESATVVVNVDDSVCPAIILSSTTPAFKTPGGVRPVTIEYKAGVDNGSQQG